MPQKPASRFKPPAGSMVVDASDLTAAPVTVPQNDLVNASGVGDPRVLYDPNRKPASAEDFLPAKPEGSPVGRFVSNAWDVLNPMQLLESLNALINDPVPTLGNVVVQQSMEASKALQAAAQGRGTEASGHTLAAMLPVIGPQAAMAGEQIGSGDVAGGLGRGAGLLAPVAVPAGARATVRGVSRIAPEGVPAALERGAASRVADVMSPKVGPNKIRLGNQAEQIAPELAKRGELRAWSREGLHRNVEAGLADAERALDAASNDRLVSQQVNAEAILKRLDERIARLTATPAEGSRVVPSYRGDLSREARPLGKAVEPAPNATEIDTLRQIRAEVASLGPRAPYEAIRRIREAWDKVAKAKYLSSTAADAMKSQGEATAAMKGAGAIRDALAEVDPQTAAANADYSLYRSANDVLKATAEVERTRPKVGRAIAARFTGAVVGNEAAGARGAVGGYILGPIVDAALNSGATTKLQTARFMQGLADAIRAGNTAAVDRLILKLRSLTRATVASQATSPSEPRKRPAPGLQPQGSQ